MVIVFASNSRPRVAAGCGYIEVKALSSSWVPGSVQYHVATHVVHTVVYGISSYIQTMFSVGLEGGVSCSLGKSNWSVAEWRLSVAFAARLRVRAVRCLMGKSKLSAAERAEAEAAKHRPTAQKQEARIAELEERARLFGDSAKQSAQAKVLERKWLRFLLVHGEKYKFNPRKGPTVELVKHFTTYCFCTRDVVSAIGREGLGDSFVLRVADSVHAGQVCVRGAQVQGLGGDQRARAACEVRAV